MVRTLAFLVGQAFLPAAWTKSKTSVIWPFSHMAGRNACPTIDPQRTNVFALDHGSIPARY